MPDLGEKGLRETLGALARALDPCGTRYMLIGGIAVIARGVPRQTVDVDATVWAEEIELDDLFDALRAQGIVPRVEKAAEFARLHQVLLLVHEESSTQMEISLAWLPFEREALEAAEKLTLGGVVVPVARVEDLLIYKAVAWRDRDRADIERLIPLHSGEIDLGRVRRVLGEFAVALEEPERMREFDRLVTRATRGA